MEKRIILIILVLVISITTFNSNYQGEAVRIKSIPYFQAPAGPIATPAPARLPPNFYALYTLKSNVWSNPVVTTQLKLATSDGTSSYATLLDSITKTCGNTDCSSLTGLSMDIDSFNNPHIAYLRNGTSSTTNWTLIYKKPPSVTEIVPLPPAIMQFLYTGTDFFNDYSKTFLTIGPNNIPYIVMKTKNPTTGLHTIWVTKRLTTWQPWQQIITGDPVDMEIDASGNVYVLYVQLGPTLYLKVIKCSFVIPCSFSPIASTTNLNYFLSYDMDVDSSNNVHVVYGTLNGLKYAKILPNGTINQLNITTNVTYYVFIKGGGIPLIGYIGPILPPLPTNINFFNLLPNPPYTMLPSFTFNNAYPILSVDKASYLGIAYSNYQISLNYIEVKLTYYNPITQSWTTPITLDSTPLFSGTIMKHVKLKIEP